MRKFLFLGLLALLFPFAMSAQIITVSGTVYDSATNEPLAGVTVVQTGTQNGTITDINGNYTISVPSDSSLTFSYDCYIPATVLVYGKTILPVHLTENTQKVEYVVVTGYGTKKKSDIWGKNGHSKFKRKGTNRGPKGGLLTSAEINDFAKWSIWDSIVTQKLSYCPEAFELYPKKRFVLQLTNLFNIPLPNAKIQLIDDQSNTVWSSITDNTGKAELWANFYEDKQVNNNYTIQCEYQGEIQQTPATPFNQGINFMAFNKPCFESKNVDIMFIIDATGSMSDEFEYLKGEIVNVMKKIQTKNKNLNINTGSVFYRGKNDGYITKILPLTSDYNAVSEFINKQDACGGGDFGEAIPEALEEAFTNGNWRDTTLAKIVFLVLDDHCGFDSATLSNLHKQINFASKNGIRIVPIACSGISSCGEYLIRALALATNGTSFFLTDDSGIGEWHDKPSTDKIKVEKLNDMLIRTVLEFTKIPDCENENWDKDNITPEDIEQFVPNPYEFGDIPNLENDNQLKPNSNTKIKVEDIIKVAPNPCNTQFSISTKKNISDMFLVDVTGKMIRKFGVQNKNESINVDVTGFSTGIYFLKILYQGGWYTHKEIIRGR